MNAHASRFKLIKEFRWRLVTGMLVMLLTIVLQLSLPKFAAYFIDNFQSLVSQQQLWQYILLVAAIVIIHAFSSAARYYIFESTGLLIVKKARNLMHRALTRNAVAFYDSNSAAELASRLSTDVEQLQDTLTMGLAISIRSLCVLVGCIIMLLYLSPILSVCLLPILPLQFYFSRWLGNNVMRLSEDIQQKQAENNKLGFEHLSNIRLIHAFNGQSKLQNKYQDAAQRHYQMSLSRTSLLAKVQIATVLVTYFAILLLFVVGASLISAGNMSIGELTSFVIYAGMLTACTSAIGDFWNSWMNALGATSRVFSFIEQNKNDDDGTTTLTVSGDISFSNVCFSYPSRPGKQVLHDISFNIAAGKKVALLGRTGSGKSTIVNLLLGFYQCDDGSIHYDDIRLSETNIKALRQNIALVEQEPAMFSGTIRENIAFAACRDVSESDIIAAAEQAYAMEFITKLPQGLDTIVGERGLQLSGGQKQRIAIARAIIRDPKILILDEATSALDAQSERWVQKALQAVMQERTTIVIAHRLTTIETCDDIVLLKDGEIVQHGSYRELSKVADGPFCQLMQIGQSPIIDDLSLIKNSAVAALQ